MKTLLILAVLTWHPHWHWPHWHHKAPPVVVVKPAPKPVAHRRVVPSCRFTPAEAYQYPEWLVLQRAQSTYHFSTGTISAPEDGA